MVKSTVAVLAFVAASLSPGYASTTDTPCCKPHAQVSVPVNPPASPAKTLPEATAPSGPRPVAPAAPAGYAPTAYPGLFTRSVPSATGGSVPAVTPGQILMLPGGTMPELPEPTTEAEAPARMIVTPDGMTIVLAPSWLRYSATFTLGPDGKPVMDCLEPSEPRKAPAGSAVPTRTGAKAGGPK